MDNAFKYVSPKGKISVELNTVRKSHYLVVKNTISETIDKQEINKIFERFYRLDNSRNSKTGGQGIGLAIAASLVQNYQGTIKADIIDELFTISVVFPK